MSLAEDHARRQRRMKLRMLGMFAAIVVAVAIVIWYQRRERAAAVSSTETPSPALASSSAPAGSSAAGVAKPDQAVRKIDKAGRDAMLDRIRTTRSSRTGVPAGASASSSGGTPPALPPLAGSLKKDDIRAGVRAVIPLLAECYDAAQDRFTTKEGKIVVQMHLTGEPEVGTLIEKAEIEGDAHFIKDADFVECLQQTMLSVELPPIEGGGVVDVTYPIAFAPG